MVDAVAMEALVPHTDSGLRVLDYILLPIAMYHTPAVEDDIVTAAEEEAEVDRTHSGQEHWDM